MDAEGLQARGNIGNKQKRKKGSFTSRGPNWVHLLDGHDKLMGFQNSTFPLAVYGCIDTSSCKTLWLCIWVTNSNPNVIRRWYLEYLMETHVIANMIRLDKGTETEVMATMHVFLKSNHCDCNEPVYTVLYGPPTSNQVYFNVNNAEQIMMEVVRMFTPPQKISWILPCDGHFISFYEL